MRSFCLTLCVMAISSGMLCAQERGFASDPFAEEGNKAEAQDLAEKRSQGSSYSSHQEIVDTRSLVQRNAMFRAEQRRRRLAAMRWFGFSNSRPAVASVPYMTPYAPAWVGNALLPYYWHGGGYWR